MSRQEQAALVAFVNTFKLTRKVTAFDQLSDGKALMEVMSSIDGTHFKNVSSRGVGSPAGGSENWVLKMNTLKRLHRLLLSYRLPSPHPSSFSLSTLPEPPFSAIAKSPTMAEGRNGLAQLCRMCLSVGVWAPGNEKVITKIQSLGEGHMAELMKSIEGIMATFPEREGDEDQNGGPSTEKQDPDSPTTPAGDIKAERDKLLQDNDELRARCEQMMEQITELTNTLEETKTERDEAISRGSLSGSQGPGAGLRTSQTASSQVDSLRTDLARAEDNLMATEADLEKQTRLVSALEKNVEDLKVKAAEASRLKDQLDEHRHAADKLRKSENVIEKYKKKLDESAGLRRELRALEEENASLVDRNASMEADMRKAGSSKELVDNYKSQIEALEKQSREQNDQITELTLQLESSRAELADIEIAHDRDREELQLHQDQAKEAELGGSSSMKRTGSRGTLLDVPGGGSLGDEMGAADVDGKAETKTDLKLRIRALQRELTDMRSANPESSKMTTLQTLLDDANKARDRYQADYLQEHRSTLRLQAIMENVRSGRGANNSQTMSALRERTNELTEERDKLLKEKASLEVAGEGVVKQLKAAKTDLSLVDKDKQEQIRLLREDISAESRETEQQIPELKEQISALRDKERNHLEEIKRLLMDKVDLQSSGINQREKAIEREKEFGEIKAALASGGASAELQQKVLQMHDQNAELQQEITSLSTALEEAKQAVSNAPAESPGLVMSPSGDFETRIDTLKEKLHRARQANTAMEKRYRLEQQLMLSAWHELGARTVRDHISAAGLRKSVPKPVPTSWLGRQRRHQEEAAFVRT